MKQNFIKKAMNTLSYKDGVFFMCSFIYTPLFIIILYAYVTHVKMKTF